ncbi:MAG TPA: ABC transporter permease [Spirochaetia bacterium]|nr:ABC transporter permease [Spirochaetia bacterium]
MRTIGFIIRKEFQQIRRDRRMLPLIFIAPVLQIILMGYAANLDVNDIPISVCDQDRTAQSRELVTAFTASGSFAVSRTAATAEDAERDIERGASSLALIIPPGYGRQQSAGRVSGVQLLADGSESQAAAIGLSYATLVVSREAARLASTRLTALGAAGAGVRAVRAAQVRPAVRVFYNPTLASRNFMVPGVLAMVLMIITTVLTSLSIVKEKERGTLEQLIVTPITARQLIVGKLAPFVLISIVVISLVLAASLLLFGLSVRGSLPLLYALSLLFMLTTLGAGLFISTISRTQQQAMMIAVFFFIMPMVILSGFVFPIESMPVPIQLVTYLFPLRWYFVIIRGLFLKGIGIAELWKETAALAGIGLAVIAGSALRFRKRLE